MKEVLERFGHTLEAYCVENWRCMGRCNHGFKCSTCGHIFVHDNSAILTLNPGRVELKEFRAYYEYDHYAPSFTTPSCAELYIRDIIE